MRQTRRRRRQRDCSTRPVPTPNAGGPQSAPNVRGHDAPKMATRSLKVIRNHAPQAAGRSLSAGVFDDVLSLNHGDTRSLGSDSDQTIDMNEEDDDLSNEDSDADGDFFDDDDLYDDDDDDDDYSSSNDSESDADITAVFSDEPSMSEAGGQSNMALLHRSYEEARGNQRHQAKVENSRYASKSEGDIKRRRSSLSSVAETKDYRRIVQGLDAARAKRKKRHRQRSRTRLPQTSRTNPSPLRRKLPPIMRRAYRHRPYPDVERGRSSSVHSPLEGVLRVGRATLFVGRPARRSSPGGGCGTSGVDVVAASGTHHAASEAADNIEKIELCRVQPSTRETSPPNSTNGRPTRLLAATTAALVSTVTQPKAVENAAATAALARLRRAPPLMRPQLFRTAAENSWQVDDSWRNRGARCQHVI